MYVQTGTVEKKVRQIWAGRHTCGRCECETEKHLYKSVITAYAFVPIFEYTSGYLIVCDKCGTVKAISKKSYKAIEKRQKELMKNRKFPHRVLKRDYSAQALGLKKKTAGLIAALIWAAAVAVFFYFAAGDFSALSGAAIGVMSVWFVIFMIPAAVAAVKFTKTYRLYAMAKNLLKYPDATVD